ncbi:MAG: peptide chain release factor 1 [Bacteroidia bacterium]|nr:peptide chain release factor 1 [Bacteroidia bacterium]
MLDKLKNIAHRFEEVKLELSKPDAVNDMKAYTALTKEYKDLDKIVSKIRDYELVLTNIDSTKALLHSEKDEEMREMAKEELSSLEDEKEEMEAVIKDLMIPKDPEDSKNVVLEIRAGTGGDEASIFAGDLFRMYSRYAEKKGWQVAITSIQEGTSGGFKEIIAVISGEDAFGTMKFESGVHRVQRVPATESQGRIHTSAATVACMPEAEEFDIELNDADIEIERTTSTGPGGQSVNTTYSAIKLFHKPTGIRVSMQDEKSQLKNLAKAMKVLRNRVYDLELQKRHEERSSLRKSYVSSGDRSAKIRTYNFPQGRVTDHRINLTLYNLGPIMDGDLDGIIEPLRLAENAEKLKEGSF